MRIGYDYTHNSPFASRDRGVLITQSQTVRVTLINFFARKRPDADIHPNVIILSHCFFPHKNRRQPVIKLKQFDFFEKTQPANSPRVEILKRKFPYHQLARAVFTPG